MRERMRHNLLALLLFSGYRWFRKWTGGHWECWFLDPPVAACAWYPVACCTDQNPRERPGMCFYRCTCEDWARQRPTCGPDGQTGPLANPGPG